MLSIKSTSSTKFGVLALAVGGTLALIGQGIGCGAVYYVPTTNSSDLSLINATKRSIDLKIYNETYQLDEDLYYRKKLMEQTIFIASNFILAPLIFGGIWHSEKLVFRGYATLGLMQTFTNLYIMLKIINDVKNNYQSKFPIIMSVAMAVHVLSSIAYTAFMGKAYKRLGHLKEIDVEK
uniref:DUF2975 domain-containing protein n=1 Tax=Rhabditophanes sp. KR3021 TaxID=114890 RepID=A0AC35TP92_9BILA